jgi:hypothetical protein
LSKLISLDGLAKNTSKQPSLTQRLNAPVVANQAAATYVQEQGFIQQSMEQGRRGNPATSFAGLDGLGGGGMSGMGGMNMMPSMSLGTNPNVMGVGSAGGKDAISSLMDPQAMVTPKPQPQQQQQMGPAGAGMLGGGGMNNPQMMHQMMQSMTPQQQQQMMMMMQMQQQQQGMQQSFGGQPQGFGGGGFGSTSNQMGGFR